MQGRVKGFMEKKEMATTNLTQGNPFALLIRFALPLIFSGMLRQLYNFLDTTIVGRCIIMEALTAVGVTTPLNYMALGIFMGCAPGFCIPITQKFGAGDQKGFARYFCNGLYLVIGIGLLMTVIEMIFTRTFLIRMNTPGNLMELAVEYLRIIFLDQ